MLQQRAGLNREGCRPGLLKMVEALPDTFDADTVLAELLASHIEHEPEPIPPGRRARRPKAASRGAATIADLEADAAVRALRAELFGSEEPPLETVDEARTWVERRTTRRQLVGDEAERAQRRAWGLLDEKDALERKLIEAFGVRGRLSFDLDTVQWSEKDHPRFLPVDEPELAVLVERCPRIAENAGSTVAEILMHTLCGTAYAKAPFRLSVTRTFAGGAARKEDNIRTGITKVEVVLPHPASFTRTDAEALYRQVRQHVANGDPIARQDAATRQLVAIIRRLGLVPSEGEQRRFWREALDALGRPPWKDQRPRIEATRPDSLRKQFNRLRERDPELWRSLHRER